MGGRRYTPEMIDFLNQNGGMNRKELCELLNKKFGGSFTPSQVRDKCFKLGLKADVQRFEKGRKAWNKGLKNSTGSSSTRFKKGCVPTNKSPEGHEVINGYGYREVMLNGRFKLKHRVIWEQHKGKIPENHFIIFKNKDITDLRIENLECVSRAELVILSKSLSKLSTPETHETCILMAKLKSKVKQLKGK